MNTDKLTKLTEFLHAELDLQIRVLQEQNLLTDDLYEDSIRLTLTTKRFPEEGEVITDDITTDVSTCDDEHSWYREFRMLSHNGLAKNYVNNEGKLEEK